MQEFFLILKDWVLKLGIQYGVNPVLFGTIYLGAIPLFTGCVGWLIRNYRLKQSIILPAILTIFFYISSYIYLIIVGKNVPEWVYLVLAGLIGLSVYSIYRQVRKKLKEHKREADHL